MKGYYLSIANEKRGPFSEKEITGWIRSGKITLFDMVFHQQMNAWVMLMQHPDFSDLEYSQNKIAPVEAAPVAIHVTEGTFTKPQAPAQSTVISDEISLLVPLHWYLRDQPHKPLKYLEVLSLISQKKASEHTLVGKDPQGPFKPLVSWEEFSASSREEFKRTTNEAVPDVNIRRKSERHASGQNFIFLTKERSVKIYCSDISKAGLGVIVRQELFQLNQEVYVRFADKVVDNNFDAKAMIVSSRKVKLPGSDEVFIRYGIRFTHLSVSGKSYLSELSVPERSAA